MPVVVHCWGPGCDGATRAALALARLGFRVKEMLGGIEYWIREGYAVETAHGVQRRPGRPADRPGGLGRLRLLSGFERLLTGRHGSPLVRA